MFDSFTLLVLRWQGHGYKSASSYWMFECRKDNKGKNKKNPGPFALVDYTLNFGKVGACGNKDNNGFIVHYVDI